MYKCLVPALFSGDVSLSLKNGGFHEKTSALIATAAFLALPSAAFAQLSTDALTDKVKEKAVDTVMDNMTTDDALTAGKTLLKGGSKTDAAKAVIAGRAEDKIESMTGSKVDLDDISKDGMMDAGKAMAVDKAKGSATKYIDKSSGAVPAAVMSKDGMMDAGKEMAMEKAKSSATTYTDKAKGSATTYKDKSQGSATTFETPATAEPAVSCPSGTKDAGNGTCMVTGDWKF